MSEQAGLLRAICESPDDDTHRLVYADWCDDHGNSERAEFIRLQIEIAKLPDGKKKKTRQIREEELLDAHGEKWAEPLKPYFQRLYHSIYADRYPSAVAYRRGFVERITMDASGFIADADKVFALAPIREVRFLELQSFAAIAQCKDLLRLRTLNLTGAALATEEFDSALLLRSKFLANLTTLIARGYDDNGHLDAGGLRAIAGSRHLAKLECLDISNNWMFGRHQHPPHAAACRKELWKLGEKMPALRELRMHGIGLEDGDLSGLLAQEWVGQLRVLDLSSNSLAENGCKALCESKHLAMLERLDLTGNQYYDAATASYVPFNPAMKRTLKERFGKSVTL